MSTGTEGKKMVRLFLKYYNGQEVAESEAEESLLKKLVVAGYLEYYFDKGIRHARAGRIGKLLEKPSPKKEEKWLSAPMRAGYNVR